MDEQNCDALSDEVSSYLEEIENNRVLSEEEEKKEVEKALKGDKDASSLLVESFAKRAEELASFRYDGSIPLMNLIQEANRALYYAAAHLDSMPLGCTFSSYATTVVNSCLDQYIRLENAEMEEIAEANSSGLHSFLVLPKSANVKSGESLFLSEISKFPLLSKEEEIELGKKIQAGLKENASEEEKKEGKEAQDAMVNSNIRLIMNVAKDYSRMGVPFLDLVQEGYFGLQRAVEKFDPTRGNRFSTYAYPWIKQAMQKLVNEQGRGIKISRHTITNIAKVRKTVAELSLDLGRQPTPSEIASVLPGYDEKDIEAILEISTGVVSLDAPLDPSDSDSADFLSTIKGDDDLSEGLDEEDRKKLVEKALEDLSDRERTVTTHLFGLDGKEKVDMSELGRKLGISRERVRQIRDEAIGKMRRALTKRMK